MKKNIKSSKDLSLNDNLIESFELVKELVRKSEGCSRAGVMLGLQELGATLNRFIAADCPVYSNIIIVN